jgi:hypothetical protein
VNVKGLVIFFAIPIFTITALLFNNNVANLGGDRPATTQLSKEGSASANTSVPLPSDSDSVNMFFQALKEKDYYTVLSMLDPSVINSNEAAVAWRDQFMAFESVNLKDVGPSNETSWKADEHVYKVTVTAKMTPESEKATIPYYGWGNGDIVKWITVRKGADGLWRIVGFASGM